LHFFYLVSHAAFGVIITLKLFSKRKRKSRRPFPVTNNNYLERWSAGVAELHPPLNSLYSNYLNLFNGIADASSLSCSLCFLFCEHLKAKVETLDGKKKFEWSWHPYTKSASSNFGPLYSQDSCTVLNSYIFLCHILNKDPLKKSCTYMYVGFLGNAIPKHSSIFASGFWT